MRITLASSGNPNMEYVRDTLEANGVEVFTTSTSSPVELKQRMDDSDFLVLDHTTTLNRRITEAMDDRSRIIEMSPAKVPMGRFRGEVISVGLMEVRTMGSGEYKYQWTMISDITREDSDSIMPRVFGSQGFLEATAAGFDKAASELLVKPYIMYLLSRKISDLDQDPVTTHYSHLQAMSREVNNYNIDFIRDLLRNNPHTGEIFASMEENTKRVWNEMSLY